jgi:hypothetical protein
MIRTPHPYSAHILKGIRVSALRAEELRVISSHLMPVWRTAIYTAYRMRTLPISQKESVPYLKKLDRCAPDFSTLFFFWAFFLHLP